MTLHPVIAAVTARIEQRSRGSRADYEARMSRAEDRGVHRAKLSCGNLAHGFAACDGDEKRALTGQTIPNLAIVSAYNDMLSAHQPFVRFPDLIKRAARQCGAVAQFAGGVPAMCDGVTQGQDGMELSLFSRDVIAMSTAIALSHNMFDGNLCLGVCDKIVPGLLIGALSFGHLPTVFVPAGPMASGLPNLEKTRIRQLYAQGKVGRDELLAAEAKSYHSPGTCTFYGTANSNQLLMEFMGLHLPGSSFVNPNNPLRDPLTAAATHRLVELVKSGEAPLWRIIEARALVNGIIGLLCSGGSTNHTIHLIAIARAAGLSVDWDDFAELSAVVPLLCRIYPNGQADVNHFHAAGGIALMIRQLLEAGLLHENVLTVAGQGLARYTQEPFLEGEQLVWREGPSISGDPAVLATTARPFDPEGGMKLVTGNLGRGIVKTSAVKVEHRKVRAAARVFTSQDSFLDAFKAGELNRDLVAVVRFQGPMAIGMPELHKLTPALGVLQDQGHKVALVTDGRMSGASGKVLAAIHITPEALAGGPLARVQDGDIIEVDSDAGRLTVEVEQEAWAARPMAEVELAPSHWGMGRELFAPLRHAVCGAEQGGTIFGRELG